VRKAGSTRFPRENVQVGLQILARIIAREALKDRLAKIDSLHSHASAPDPCPMATVELVEKVGQT
jgi:hypothetical protein